MEMRIFNINMVEIDILRIPHKEEIGCSEGYFPRFGCPKGHPDALLAKIL